MSRYSGPLAAIVAGAVIAAVVSIILYPEWLSSSHGLIQLGIRALVGALTALAAFVTILERWPRGLSRREEHQGPVAERQRVSIDSHTALELDSYPVLTSITGPRHPPWRPRGPLPPPQPSGEFVPRAATQAALLRALDVRRESAIVGIVGTPGAGKTELAINLANQLGLAFPLGALWVEAADRPIEAMVGDLESALSLIPQAGQDLRARIQAVRGILAQHPGLVIFDDIREGHLAATRDLLPPSPPCASILTSRLRTLPIPPDAIHDLEPLTPEQAMELLTSRGLASAISSEATAADSLAEVCAYHPLALDLAARRLREELVAGGTIQGFSRSLKSRLKDLEIDPSDPQGSLRACFDQSYDHLGQSRQERFRCLGVFPTTGFSGEAAGSIWRIGAEDARRELLGLVDRSLVRRLRPDRFALHDLLAEYAVEKLSEAREDTSARRAHAEYFVRFAETQYLREDWQGLAPEFDNLALAFEFASEHDLALAYALSLATPRFYWSIGRWDEGVRVLRELLPRATDPRMVAVTQHSLAQLLEYRGEFAEAERLYRSSLQAAISLHDRAGEGVARSTLADLLVRTGRSHEAEVLYRESLAILEAIGDEREGALVESSLGDLLLLKGRHVEAEALYRRGLQTLEALGDERDLMGLQSDLAWLLMLRGLHEEAEPLFRASLRSSEAVGDRHGTAARQHNLAELLLRTGKMEEAESLLRSSVNTLEALGDKPGVAVAQSTLAWLQLQKGEIAEAEQLYRASLEAKEVIGDPRALAETQDSLAQLLLSRGEYKAAEELFRTCLETVKALGDAQALAVVQSNLAWLLIYRGEYVEAEKLFLAGMKMATDAGDPHGVAVAEVGLAEAYSYQGKNHEKAERLCRRGLEAFDRMQDTRWMAITQSSLGSLLVRRSEFREGETLLRASLVTFRTLGEPRRAAVSLMAVADLLFLKDELVGAESMYRESLVQFESIGERREAAHARLRLAMVLMETNRSGEAEGLLQRTLEAGESLPDPLLRGLCLIEMGKVARTKKDVRGALIRVNQAIEIFDALGLKDRSTSARELVRSLTSEGAGQFD